jgi:hypothetical protein
MKRSLATTVAFLFLLGLPIVAMAQEPPPQEQPPQEQPQEQPRAEPVTSVSGTVKAVDASTNQLTMETADKQQVNVGLDENTKVTIGDKPGTLADLKPGQAITVEVQGSKAITITVSS